MRIPAIIARHGAVDREGGYTLTMLQPSEILEAALKLDPEEREGLIDELAASLDATDLGEYWEAEIKRRIEDVDSGKVKTVPSEEVFARLEQRFRGR